MGWLYWTGSDVTVSQSYLSIWVGSWRVGWGGCMDSQYSSLYTIYQTCRATVEGDSWLVMTNHTWLECTHRHIFPSCPSADSGSHGAKFSGHATEPGRNHSFAWGQHASGPHEYSMLSHVCSMWTWVRSWTGGKNMPTHRANYLP